MQGSDERAEWPSRKFAATSGKRPTDNQPSDCAPQRRAPMERKEQVPAAGQPGTHLGARRSGSAAIGPGPLPGRPPDTSRPDTRLLRPAERNLSRNTTEAPMIES